MVERQCARPWDHLEADAVGNFACSVAVWPMIGILKWIGRPSQRCSSRPDAGKR